jgi:ABC-type proline/glycine betaine transport system ATPase subunit
LLLLDEFFGALDALPMYGSSINTHQSVMHLCCRLLLLDEPFGALDAVVRKTLRSGLKEIVRSVGVTTIIVTHDQEEAFEIADKVGRWGECGMKD